MEIPSSQKPGCNRTILRPRLNVPEPVPASPIAEFGFPGIPFVPATPPVPVFSQGETIVYDAQLCVDGALIAPTGWDIKCILKKSEFAIEVLWQGILNNGLYFSPNTSQYQIWIPSDVTADLFAGTYFMDVIASELIGSGTGVKDRTILLITLPIGIRYTPSSPHPDSADTCLPGRLPRTGVEPTYPLPFNPLRPML
jgi:hypothetical protein